MALRLSGLRAASLAFLKGGKFMHNSGASRSGIAKVCFVMRLFED